MIMRLKNENRSRGSGCPAYVPGRGCEDRDLLRILRLPGNQHGVYLRWKLPPPQSPAKARMGGARISNDWCINFNRTQSNPIRGLSSIEYGNRNRSYSHKKYMGNRTQWNARFPNSWFLLKKKTGVRILRSITGFWRLELLQYKCVCFVTANISEKWLQMLCGL